jgi:hypothetical protein
VAPAGLGRARSCRGWFPVIPTRCRTPVLQVIAEHVSVDPTAYMKTPKRPLTYIGVSLRARLLSLAILSKAKNLSSAEDGRLLYGRMVYGRLGFGAKSGPFPSVGTKRTYTAHPRTRSTAFAHRAMSSPRRDSAIDGSNTRSMRALARNSSRLAQKPVASPAR